MAHAPQSPTQVDTLEAHIQTLLESLLELGICTSEVHPSALEHAHTAAVNGSNGIHDASHDQQQRQDAQARQLGPGGLVGRKAQDTVEAMATLFDSHSQLPETRELLLLPNEVIDYVDQGRNPDIYARELVERVAGENMYTHGILDAVSSYRELLAQEMKLAFPAMSSAIDELGITGLHGASAGASTAAAIAGQTNHTSPSNDIKMEG